MKKLVELIMELDQLEMLWLEKIFKSWLPKNNKHETYNKS